MKKLPNTWVDKATRAFLPPECPYEQWRLLSHWWRMKIYVLNSPMRDIQAAFIDGARELANPRDVSEFMFQPQIAATLNAMLNIPLGFDRLEESSEIASWHMQTMMHLEGVVYAVAPRLAKLLQETRLHGVDCSLVRAPHRVMFMEIPKSSGLQVYNRDTGWHPVEGAYVIETDRVFRPEVFAARREPPPPNIEPGDTFREIRVQVLGSSKDPENAWDDAAFNFRIRMDSGTIEDAIDREMSLVSNLWGRHQKEAKDVVQQLFGFVVNVLLYCTSVDADIVKRLNPAWEILRNKESKAKSDKKRKRLRQELGKIDKRETKVLGSRLVTGKAPLGDQTAAKSSEGTGIALVAQQLVSGHWKGVWRGSEDPDRSKELGPRRKLPMWIQPYQRGPELAEQIHASYKVDLPTKGKA